MEAPYRRHPERMVPLRCMAWNIRGVIARGQHKLRDTEVLAMIRQHDIIGIIESHTDGEEDLDIEGYQMAHNPRRKPNRGLSKNYGGIIMYYKKDRLRELEIIQPFTTDCIWAKWQDGRGNKTVLGLAYVPPGETMVHDPMKHVRAGLQMVKQGARVLLMGDMNARVGNFKPSDDEKASEYTDCIPEWEVWDEKRWRRELRDPQLNTYGREINRLAEGSGMECLNGTTKETGIQGSYTCFAKIDHPTGVDQAWCNTTDKESILSFQVMDFMPDLSDHCPISIAIREEEHPPPIGAFYGAHPGGIGPSPKPVPVTMTKARWTEEEKDLVSRALGQESIATRTKKISANIAKVADGNDMNKVIEDINNMITTTMMEQCETWSVRKPNPLGEASKPDQPWFNKECEGAKGSLRDWAKKHKNSDRKDDPVYYGLQTRYRQVQKEAERTYRQQIIHEMMDTKTKDPRQWWILLRKLNYERINDKRPREISIQIWARHFEGLLRKKRILDGSQRMAQTEPESLSLLSGKKKEEVKRLYWEHSRDVSREEVDRAVKRTTKPHTLTASLTKHW